MTQHVVSSDLISNLSPVIYNQNLAILKLVAKQFKIDEKTLLDTIMPNYLDCVYLRQQKKSVPCTYLFPEMKILTPKKGNCLARIIADKNVSQCCRKKAKGCDYCEEHKEKLPWGNITIPHQPSTHKCRLIMDLQHTQANPANEIICDEWIYDGVTYYWDTNTNLVYNEEGVEIGRKIGNSLSYHSE